MASEKTYPMTESALEDLRAELAHKVDVERPELAARLKAAIEMGDLSENADYAAAKEAQSFLEGRIQELQTMLRGAEIIDENGPTDRVRLGTHVTLREKGEDNKEVFQIVGQVEANPRAGKISDESPLGQALINARVGDTVRYQAPVGELVFEVLSID